jgi:hypothetical protein
LADPIRSTKIKFASGPGVLQLTNNRLSGLVIGKDPWEQLLGLRAAGGTLAGIYQMAALTNNVLATTLNVWMAQNHALSSNLFSMATQAQVAAAPVSGPVAVVIGHGASYMGNHAPHAAPLGQLSDLTNHSVGGRIGNFPLNLNLDLDVVV